MKQETATSKESADLDCLVYEIEIMPDGSRKMGNSFLVSKKDAIAGIKSGQYATELAPMGVIPEAWV